MENVKIPLPARPEKFLDQFRAFIRLDGKSYATENTYVYWVHQYILFHRKEHPAGMGGLQVAAYLSHLAIAGNASPNTQKTALLLIFYFYITFDFPILKFFSLLQKILYIPLKDIIAA